LKVCLLLVANHPFGAIEALVLLVILARTRPGAKLLANAILTQLPELGSALIPVQILAGPQANARANLAAMKNALQHLLDGQTLGIFPAGQVSSFTNWGDRQAVDIAWNPHLGRLAQKSRATVVPIYFEGQNSRLFQYLSLAIPQLRIPLIAREMLYRKGRVGLRVGRAISPAEVAGFGDARAITQELRRRTYTLANIPQPAREPIVAEQSPARRLQCYACLE
jgi:putative hemolysin